MEPLKLTPRDHNPAPQTEREVELLKAVEECEVCLRKGESIDREAVLAAHPAIRENLASCLAGLELVYRTGRTLEVPAEVPRPEFPIVLGDFRIIREIGRGGMGIVFEAEQGSLRRRVALKVLPFAAVLDSKQVQRFRNEVQAAAQIHHTNVVPVYSVGCERGIHYYAMQLVDGRTLEELIHVAAVDADAPLTRSMRGARGSFDWVARLGIEAAEALHHAHELGILHRDVKPSNLLIDDSGKLWITDFGLARSRSASGITISGEVLGTLRYMSPEQALGKGRMVDQRTDIYSLGVTLYEVLTRQPAFPGGDREDLLRRIAQDPPPPPRRLNPWVPQDLETIILKAITKEPAARYATALELADDLRRFLETKPILARRPGLLQRAGKWALRRKAPVTAGVAVLVTLATLGGVGWREHRERISAGYQQDVRQAVLRIERRRGSGSMGAEAAGGFGGLLPYLRGEDGALLAVAGKDPLKEAIDLLGRAIDAYPRRPDAYYHRARALACLGRQIEAVGDAERALACDPAFFPARLLLATGETGGEANLGPTRGASEWMNYWGRAAGAARAGRWKEASDAYGRLVETVYRTGEPYIGASMEALLSCGYSLLEAKEHQKAAEAFAGARALWPDALEPVLFLGRTYHAMGLEEEELANQTFEEAFAKGSSPDQSAFEIAGFYFSMGSRGRRPALRWAERMREGPARERARACILYWLKRFPEAIEASERAVRLDPEDAEAHVLLGQALCDSGRMEEGLALIEAARRLDPQNAHARFALGTVLGNAGRLEEARHEYREAVGLDPRLQLLAHYELAWTLLGRADTGAGSYDDAIAEAKKAAELAPSYEGAHFTLGAILLNAGKFEDASKSCRQALRLNDRHSAAYSVLGLTLFRLGRREESLAAHKKAIALEPEEAGFRQHLALDRMLEGDFQGAAFEFREASRLLPHFAWPHAGLAGVLRRQERLAEAEAELRIAVACPDPAWSDPQRLKERLQLAQLLEEEGKPGQALGEYAEILRRDPTSSAASCGTEAILRREVRAVSPEDVDLLVEVLEGIVAVGTSQVEKTLAVSRLHAGARRDIAKAIADDLYAASEEIARSPDLRGLIPRLMPAYLEGILLSQEGDPRKAAERFREALERDPTRPEPFLALVRSLRAAGDFVDAEQVLRGGLVRELSGSREAWALWAAIALTDLNLGPVEAARRLPVTQSGDDPDYGGDFLWLFKELEAGKSILISCGSREDRFFTGGQGGFAGASHRQDKPPQALPE